MTSKLGIVPPKNFDPSQGQWGQITAAVIDGNVVFIPEMNQVRAAPGVGRQWIRRQGFRLRSAAKDNGCVVWLEKTQ